MTSSQESLNVLGQSVSNSQAAQQRTPSLAPGRTFRKVIPLDFLQRKFDVFFNQRIRPLVKATLSGTDYGNGALTLAFDDPVADGGYRILSTHEFQRNDLDIDIPVPLDHHFYFADLQSSGLTLTISPQHPVIIEAVLAFETEGPVEIHINNWSDVDLRRFTITVKFGLALDSDHHVVGLVTSPEWITTDVSIDSILGYREIVEGKIRDTVNQKVNAVLNDRPQDFSLRSSGKIVGNLTSIRQLAQRYHLSSPPSLRQLLAALGVRSEDNPRGLTTLQTMSPILTRWLVGGDYAVVGVSSEDQLLILDYIIPPGQLEPFPENPQPPLDPGLLANIDHIVVLMMENRSFDHMLGYLRKDGGRPDVEGLHGNEANADLNGNTFPSFSLSDTTFLKSPDHSYHPVMKQIDGGMMDGFVTSFVDKYPDIDDPRPIMGYHTAAHVPVYDALARQFLLCHHWFAAHPGPTFCNRFYTLTGRLNRDSSGTFEVDNPAGNDFKPVYTRTLFDHLTDHGVSWHYYEHRYCFLRMFERYTFDNKYIVNAQDPAQGFFASALAGTLPSVSFIDPNFIDEPDGQDNDDGAPSDIAAGQNLIGRVVDAVVHSPKWNKTLLLITYDEHGGFYDHVNPLDPRFRDTAKPVSGIDHYGVRVPAFVISPWVDQRAVSDVVFDHTSIAKTIARRFMSANPPDMGERVAAANDLSMILRTTPRQDIPTIPVPPAPVRNAAFARQAAPDAESDDFKEVLRTMRARYPVRR